MRRFRRLSVLVMAASALVALGGAFVACASDYGESAPSGDGDAQGLEASNDGGPTPTLDASGDVAMDVIDARAAEPFCPHGASFCADYEQTNVNLGWDDVVNPTFGTSAWSALGATRPGALELNGPAVSGGPSEVGYLWFRRRLEGLTGSRFRLEAAVRFEALPAVGYNTVVDIYIGNAIFYVYFSQTGWRVDANYYGTPCGPGPCGGGSHSGFRPPLPLHVWERITLEVDRNDAGGMSALFTSGAGERIAFDLDAVYVPAVRVDNFLAAGIAVASSATTDRKVLLDDIALTLRP